MSHISYTKKKVTILKALEECKGIVTDACKKVGISRKTFYEWCRKDEQFKSEVDDIQDITIDFVEGKLFKLVDELNPAAIFFYLKTIGQKRGYIEKQYIDHTNKGEKFDFSSTPDDELIAGITRLTKPDKKG